MGLAAGQIMSTDGTDQQAALPAEMLNPGAMQAGAPALWTATGMPALRREAGQAIRVLGGQIRADSVARVIVMQILPGASRTTNWTTAGGRAEVEGEVTTVKNSHPNQTRNRTLGSRASWRQRQTPSRCVLAACVNR